jgi:hypothetical protein
MKDDPIRERFLTLPGDSPERIPLFYEWLRREGFWEPFDAAEPLTAEAEKYFELFNRFIVGEHSDEVH